MSDPIKHDATIIRVILGFFGVGILSACSLLWAHVGSTAIHSDGVKDVQAIQERMAVLGSAADRMSGTLTQVAVQQEAIINLTSSVRAMLMKIDDYGTEQIRQGVVLERIESKVERLDGTNRP